MTLRISVIDPTTDQITSLEMDPTDPIDNLKALVEVEFGIPVAQQLLRLNNRNLEGQFPISQYGIKDNDMITVIRRPEKTQFTSLAHREAYQMKQYYESNPNELQYILHQNPTLAKALLSDDPTELVKIINTRRQEEYQRKLEEMKRIQQLESDPFNPDNQRMIEEEIQKQNIQSNLEIAQEHMPENFGQINMLYIEITVNKMPIQAFVDSGAQSTIMSQACAERCGVMRLVDRRYSGMALGVGTQRILGRVHVIDIQIMDRFIPCSLTILEGDSIDFLLGLDTLKRFQCSIDLKTNKLVFPNEGIHVPFLGEGSIKRHISVEQEKQMLDAENKSKSEILPSAPKPIADKETKKETKPPVVQQQQQQVASSAEQSVTTLVNMGFSRPEAIQALRACGGNVEMAAALLTQQKYGF